MKNWPFYLNNLTLDLRKCTFLKRIGRIEICWREAEEEGSEAEVKFKLNLIYVYERCSIKISIPLKEELTFINIR